MTKAPTMTAVTPGRELLDQCWSTLVEMTDRTSPEEYPDMCLITRDELDRFLRLAAKPADEGALEALKKVASWADIKDSEPAEKVNEMIKGDPEIDREAVDGPRKTFDHARSDTLQKMETATRLTRDYQPIEPHFGDVGTIRAIGEKFVRVAEIVNRSEPERRLIEQPKPDRQGDRCAACGLKRRDHNYSGAAYGTCGKFIEPTCYAAEGAGPVVSLSDFAKTEWAGGVRLLTAPPQPAPDAMREALQHIMKCCKEGARRDVIHDLAKDALSAPVPPADGTGDLTNDEETLVRRALIASGTTIEELFSSATGAAENSAPAAVRESACSTPRSPASAAMGLSAGVEAGAAEPDALADLVSRFSKALLAKLRLAQANGRSGWERDDWEVACQQGLLRHVDKGDPRDVAAYCAFMWHHGWITATPPVRGDREAIALAIFKSRMKVGDQAADVYFARHASHPHAIDDSTMAVDAAFRDADAILSLPVQPGAGEREVIFSREECIFKYCPSPQECKAACSSAVRSGQ